MKKLSVILFLFVIWNSNSQELEKYKVARSMNREFKLLFDKNNIEMPSQVIEHKMYRENKFEVRKNE